MAAVAESSAANTPPFSADSGGAGVAVVGPEYCYPYTVELDMRKKAFSMSKMFDITDVSNNKLLFRVESPFSFSGKLRVVDAAGVPILTLKPKFGFSIRWQVFRGESDHLICSVKRSSGFRTKLKVYLPNNTTRKLCDFHLKRSFLDGPYEVYAGESKDAILAQMHKKHTAGSFFMGYNQFMVTIHPKVDHAFIVALIVILDAIKSRSSGGGGAGASG
ncbi:OLC1v1005974C1 [Oldenlandia corymbosa var. corymbosa]|uniref:OLC1v1005974C1 n=1 Tax=Oldenlandia corymbosa var. corymbosa TaxID=529605 RepID=A0AAV1DI85_OLDCO|nr:OLC1v1005974C1 [Oldenlandia corymbosa var. corymbosa]